MKEENMDKSKFEKMSLSELFMLIRNGSGAVALSASEEIERRLDECLCNRFLHQVTYSSNGVWRCGNCKRVRR